MQYVSHNEVVLYNMKQILSISLTICLRLHQTLSQCTKISGGHAPRPPRE